MANLDKEKTKSDEELLTVEPSGAPVTKRVDNPEAAYNIFEKLKRQHESIAFQRAKIQGQLDGNAPYSRSERTRLGLNWMHNINFGRARSTVRLNATSVWNMLVSVETFVNMMLIDPNDQDEAQPGTDWGRIVAEEFTKIMLSEEDFYYNTMFWIKEMVSHGLGPVYWEDEECWKSHATKVANILFPIRTKSKKSAINLLCLRDEIDPVELFEMIGNGDPDAEKIAESEGWNVKECKRVLINAYIGGGQNKLDEFAQSVWETTQQKIKSHAYETDAEFDGVKIVRMLVEEIGGTVTQLIFTENDPGKVSKGDTKTKRRYMYEKEAEFSKMSRAIHFILFDIGNGDMSSVRGLGFELFHTEDVSNRLLNTTTDSASMSNSLIVQPQGGDDIGKLQVTKLGPVVAVPPQLTLVQSSFTPNISQSLETLRLMFNLENSNAGVYKSGADDIVSQQQKTATQVEAEQVNEARFESNQSAWYYVQWEAWLKETLRRMLRHDYPQTCDGYHKWKRFYDACIARGVPRELMVYDKWNIRATRAIGLGSPVLAQRQTQWLLNMLPLLDEQGRRNAVRDAIQVRFGADKLQRYAPLSDRNEIMSDAHSLAMLENNDLREGHSVLVGVDQYHTIHLQIHLRDAMSSIQAFQQNPQMDVVALARYIQANLQHSVEHLRLLASDPSRKTEVDEYTQIVQQLAQAHKQLESQVQQIQKAQQERAKQEQELLRQAKEAVDGREERIAMEKIKSEERIEMAKAASLDRSRDAKTQTQIDAKNAQLLADLQEQNVRLNADLTAKYAKLAAELAEIRKDGAEQ